MSGYTPVFQSIFDGTLHGKWPQTGIWLSLLAMADRHGEIDRSPKAIASDIGVDIDTLMICIAEFCEPDPMSRSRDNDGRRLELIDPERPWGWRVLNHAKYREKARLAAKNAREIESGSNRERMSERDRRRPPVTAADRLSDSDTNSDTDSGIRGTAPALNGAAHKPKPDPKRACALPSDFGLTDSRREYATEKLPNVDADELFAAFCDYHKGKGTVGKDWDAYWHTYVRNALKFGYPMLRAAAKQAEKIVRYDARGRVIQ